MMCPSPILISLDGRSEAAVATTTHDPRVSQSAARGHYPWLFNFAPPIDCCSIASKSMVRPRSEQTQSVRYFEVSANATAPSTVVVRDTSMIHV